MQSPVDHDAFVRHGDVPMKLARAAAFWAKATRSPRPCRSTLQRWIIKGVRGHRLPAERFGAMWFIRPADLLAFHVRLNSGVRLPAAAEDERRSAADQRLDGLTGGDQE